MSLGPWCTRKDEAGVFSPAGFWLLFNPALYRCVPLVSKSCRGFSAELSHWLLAAILHRVWGNRRVSCDAGGARGRSRRRGRSCLQDERLHPQISLPRCELLCEGEVDVWCAYCLRALCSAQGERRGGTWPGKGVPGWGHVAGQSHGVLRDDDGAGTIWKGFFVGRARTKGDGRRDAMTTFGGFPGNQGHHGNCITPVRISDFRWKACSPL